MLWKPGFQKRITKRIKALGGERCKQEPSVGIVVKGMASVFLDIRQFCLELRKLNSRSGEGLIEDEDDLVLLEMADDPSDGYVRTRRSIRDAGVWIEEQGRPMRQLCFSNVEGAQEREECRLDRTPFTGWHRIDVHTVAERAELPNKEPFDDVVGVPEPFTIHLIAQAANNRSTVPAEPDRILP
jgi:hypothetical protein